MKFINDKKDSNFNFIGLSWLYFGIFNAFRSCLQWSNGLDLVAKLFKWNQVKKIWNLCVNGFQDLFSMVVDATSTFFLCGTKRSSGGEHASCGASVSWQDWCVSEPRIRAVPARFCDCVSFSILWSFKLDVRIRLCSRHFVPNQMYANH